jgi:hypothetical protein
MPKHASNSRLGPLLDIVLWLACFAFTGGLATWEAARIADARATVVTGWAAGIAAGVGGGLALAALVALTVSAQRRRPSSRRGRRLGISVLTFALLTVVAFLSSVPPRQFRPNPPPYVITSGVEVAEIGYVGVCFAGFAVAVIVAGLAALVRWRRPPG